MASELESAMGVFHPETFCGKWVFCQQRTWRARATLHGAFWFGLGTCWIVLGAIALTTASLIVLAGYRAQPRLTNLTAPTLAPTLTRAPAAAPTAPTLAPTHHYSETLQRFWIGAREFSIPKDVQHYFIGATLTAWLLPWAVGWALYFGAGAALRARGVVNEGAPRAEPDESSAGGVRMWLAAQIALQSSVWRGDTLISVLVLLGAAAGTLLWPLPALCLFSPLIVGVSACLLTFCFQINV
jgi:hypothetical protein